MSLAEPEQTSTAGDIIGSAPSRGWVVCGWFTPDYRPMAEALAQQLAVHGAPHHILAAEKTGSWARQILRKPNMVQRAMREHPNDVIVFMDVDCEVRGPLDDVSKTAADLTCSLFVKRRRGRQRNDLSSRVIVVRPTPGAHQLVNHWIQQCQEANSIAPEYGDECALMVALSRCTTASWSAIDPRFAGRELPQAPAGAVIVHDSAHESSSTMRRVHRSFKTWKRSVFGATTRDLVVK
jgi:hypothetical protein